MKQTMRPTEGGNLARGKKEPTPGEIIAQRIIEEYRPRTAEEADAAVKDVFGPIFESILKGEMDSHLGYSPNERGPKASENRRNGYSKKTVRTSRGPMEISVPRDRDGSFEPQIVEKHSRDVSSIEDRVISMYAKGMSTRDISDIVKDIYGFDISAEMVSNITDRVVDDLAEWQNRPLKAMYSFMFVDCMYVNVKRERRSEKRAVYVALAYDLDGHKDVLGLWVGESEGKHFWMGVFDELHRRGVQDVAYICMDGVSGLEEGAGAVFPLAVVQRCIVHLIRSSCRFVADKDMKAFCADVKAVYTAPSFGEAEALFSRFKETWEGRYKGGVGVWERNFAHIEQLFECGSDVRRAMYTTNAIESVNSSFRKVTKKGSFPNEQAALKALYLRVTELYGKWGNGQISNWKRIRNQLMCDPRIEPRILKYEAFDY